MSKYKIGDMAWYAGREYSEVYVKCPDCLGSGQLTVRFADGKEVSIECATCAKGYEPPTGRVSYNAHKIFVRQVTINKVNSDTSGTEYGFPPYYVAKETEFFDTKEEAEKRAQEIADAATVEGMNRINKKEKPTRTWAWNASYHRRCIKDAEKQIAYHSAKLNAASINAKGAA